ncbi:MAG: phytanoyl-CoA dioxygenase family protein [Planctomycetes bacterium]|nr:phytanoyl-CoA dioxygenase family protein [Planctomycetota bacterium]
MARTHIISTEQIACFRKHGYLRLDDVLTEAEVQQIELIYDRFMRAEVKAMGRDFCDMSGPYDRKFQDYALVNAMLPRVYAPELQGNVFEEVTASIAAQLIGADTRLDYDQFLAKKPGCPSAQFAWHQDQGYWPAGTPDTRTATFSLAIDDSLKSNGCIRFIPGSGAPKQLRKHRAVQLTRDDSHTLVIDVGVDEPIEYLEVKRGGITVHDEWVVHGSAGNPSDGWRRTYVCAYRSQATIDYERSIGFTHSHNDTVNWKTTLGAFQDGRSTHGS